MEWRVSQAVTAGCSIAFLVNIIQSYLAMRDQVEDPLSRHSLADMAFPVLIKVRVSPGYNATALLEAGYSSTEGYFAGQSRHRPAHFGWAGHTEDGGVQGTVEEVFHRVTQPNALSDVLEGMTIITSSRKERTFTPENVSGKLVQSYPDNFFYVNPSKNCPTASTTNLGMWTQRWSSHYFTLHVSHLDFPSSLLPPPNAHQTPR